MTSLTLFSPSGVVLRAPGLRLAAKRLKALGFETQIDESALARQQRFAGDDDTRLAALHRVAAAAPSVAMATRGGYGISRLLDRIDWTLMAQCGPWHALGGAQRLHGAATGHAGARFGRQLGWADGNGRLLTR